jgi:peptide/nickel transport system substrate-binding protein
LEEDYPLRTKLRVRLGVALCVALGAVATVFGVSSAGAAHSAQAPTITVLYGTAPDYLDPQEGYTTQSAEATWVSYLGLYGYAHKSGAAGGAVIPALAAGEPKITNGGKTYTITLRPNLKYSNGKPVQATDFAYSIERALKINWGGDSFYTGLIVGAAAYQNGKASSISGIVANNATRTIVIHLLSAYGPFPNILSFPSSGLVPAGTPMKTATTTMPAGVGPYMITNVNPGKSWEGQINPYYAKEAIPGIPVAKVNVQARVEANTSTEAEDVLNNTADVFDTGDVISPALLPQVKAKASNRYGTTPVVQTFYFFLNTTIKPFNSILVRKALVMAIDRNALSKLDSGNLVPGCYFLPIGMVGHPTKPCPYGNPKQSPTAATIAKAKQLIAQAGDTGVPVTVYSQERQPRTQFVTYYASLLQSLGFKVTIKSVVDANYFPTVGNLKLNAQTGFADWLEDFPNPADFYLLLDKNSIQQVNNQNFSQVNDPKIQNAITQLDQLPPSQLSSHGADWAALDYYVAQKAYELVYGYPVDPTFVSTRIDFKAARVQPTYGWDWTSFQLNG